MTLQSLPPDALVSVLCRCPAADHPALWRTCRALRSALDSDVYKSERATSGWAEVTTRLRPGREMYDVDHPDGPDVSEDEEEDMDAKRRRRREEDCKEWYSELGYRQEYGVQSIHFEIKVDGVVAGSMNMVLVPRPLGGRLFHEATDAHSRELCEVGWTLCDNAGVPKFKSIRDADDDYDYGYGPNMEGGFLHIKTVRVDPPYRARDCTFVVAEALWAALMASELEDKWTLATAISDYNVYMTSEDKRRERELRDRQWRRMGGNDSDGDRGEKEIIMRRQKECAIVDARTYLRIGYKQIPEVVGSDKDNPVWLFAVPCFLEEPMLTAAEAAEIQLHEPPETPPEPHGVDEELLKLIKKSSNSMRTKIDQLEQTERTVAKQLEEMGQRVEEKMAQADRMKNLLGGERPDHLSEEKWNECKANLREVDDEFEGFQDMRDNLTRQLSESSSSERCRLDEDRNATILVAKTLVTEKGSSVRKSFAIHCAARLRITEYVDALLELVPPPERGSAMSEQDNNGTPPLICAMMGTPEHYNADEYHTFARHLMDLGADSNATDAFGRTALGQHRQIMSSRLNYTSVFGSRPDDGLDSWRGYHYKMEAALRPTRGETDADCDAMPSAFDEELPWDMAVDDDEDDSSFDDDSDMGEEGDDMEAENNDGNDNRL